MPNVNDLNQFVAATDVHDGDVIEFINAGEFNDKDFSDAQDGSDIRTMLNIGILLPSGKEKLYSPNKTTRNNLAGAYGPDSEGWVGKKAVVELLKMNVRGTIRSVIYLTPKI